MKKIENECVGCKILGLYCLGNSCPYQNVVRFYCDRCGYEKTLRHYNDEQICEDCLLKEFEIVEGSDEY